MLENFAVVLYLDFLWSNLKLNLKPQKTIGYPYVTQWEAPLSS